MRTLDVNYGADYWESLDGGRGYQDGTFWEDMACAVRECMAFDDEQKRSDKTEDRNPVLDVGCAKGFLVGHLLRRGFNAFGCDFSEYAVANKSPDLPGARLARKDITRDSIRYQDVAPNRDPSTSWGMIVCLETLEHIPEDSVDFVLTSIRNALRPGGLALLTICTSEVEGWDSDPTHITIKPQSWWAEKLAQQGFSRELWREEMLRSWQFFASHPGVFVIKKPEEAQA